MSRGRTQLGSFLGMSLAGLGTGQGSMSQLTLASNLPRGERVPRQGWHGEGIYEGTWWEVGTRQGPLEGVWVHSGPSQKGGSFFSKLQPAVY